ncbi:hypothetical protein PoB_006778000 [Plakobranchus ocellatus]|uniref:Uncharacterized protein n=1 Tax=Plakobranchus ocellatus TaxID=259542 RepID=A0AAV4DAZ7_9GAST|nr:hypothetical protein PoB_006778000 [Plakobranchus ocellatus]
MFSHYHIIQRRCRMAHCNLTAMHLCQPWSYDWPMGMKSTSHWSLKFLAVPCAVRKRMRRCRNCIKRSYAGVAILGLPERAILWSLLVENITTDCE